MSHHTARLREERDEWLAACRTSSATIDRLTLAMHEAHNALIAGNAHNAAICSVCALPTTSPETERTLRQISDQAAAERVITAYLRGECPEGDVKVMLDRLADERTREIIAERVEKDRELGIAARHAVYQADLISSLRDELARARDGESEEIARLRAQVARSAAENLLGSCGICRSVRAILAEPAPEGQR